MRLKRYISAGITFVLAASMFVLSACVGRAEARGMSAICDNAAHVASDEVNVPIDILLAITRLETGRARQGLLQPWPWAANIAGESRWYATRSEAQREIGRMLGSGHRNIDIGCFQLNYRWHSDGFSSLDHMFEPVRNALYAARFLRRLHAEFGSWDHAVAAYHSRTPRYAALYMTRYRDIHASLPGDAAEMRTVNARTVPSGPRPLDLSRRTPLAVVPTLPFASTLARDFISGPARPLFDGAP